MTLKTLKTLMTGAQGRLGLVGIHLALRSNLDSDWLHNALHRISRFDMMMAEQWKQDKPRHFVKRACRKAGGIPCELTS